MRITAMAATLLLDVHDNFPLSFTSKKMMNEIDDPMTFPHISVMTFDSSRSTVHGNDALCALQERNV